MSVYGKWERKTHKRRWTETVALITNDGRNLVGILRGADQHINVILGTLLSSSLFLSRVETNEGK